MLLDSLLGKTRQVMNPDRTDTESNAGSVTPNQCNRQETEVASRKNVTEELAESGGRTGGNEAKSEDAGTDQEMKGPKVNDSDNKEGKQASKRGFSPYTNKKP